MIDVILGTRMNSLVEALLPIRRNQIPEQGSETSSDK